MDIGCQVCNRRPSVMPRQSEPGETRTRKKRSDCSDEVSAVGRKPDRHLRLAHDCLSAALRRVADGVVLGDVHGTVTYMNRRAEEITLWSATSAIGRPIDQIVALVDEATGRPIEPFGALALSRDAEARPRGAVGLARRNGVIVPVEVTAAPLGGGSQTLGVVMTFRDVQPLRSADDELQRAR